MKNEAFPEEDYISQLETSEGITAPHDQVLNNKLGNTLYTISRLKTHATDIKTYFNFGNSSKSSYESNLIKDISSFLSRERRMDTTKAIVYSKRNTLVC